MVVKGSAISVSHELDIAFKHLLSFRQNLLHHNRSADHLLRNTSPRMYFFVAKIASVRLRVVAYGLQNHFPNLNMVEEPQYLKQLKTVVTIICSEKLKVMIYLLVRLSIIDHIVKKTFVKQLILVWTFYLKLQQSDMEAAHIDAFTEVCQ